MGHINILRPLSQFWEMEEFDRRFVIDRTRSKLDGIVDACVCYFENRCDERSEELSCENPDVCIAIVYVLACNALGELPDPALVTVGEEGEGENDGEEEEEGDLDVF